MARRKEVFQSKVLQRLFPAAPKHESSRLQVENPPNPPCRRRKASRPSATGAAAGKTAEAPGRREYTVLPPPADYRADSERSHARFQLDGTSDKDTAGSRGDTDGEQEEGKGRKRRKRRKKKPSLRPDCEEDGAQPSVAPGQGNEEGGGVSKNRRRKLKKKRRKEKLLSMGLVPQAAAVEFTYRKDDEGGRSVAEVSDFLRSIMKRCGSDSSLPDHELRRRSGTVEDLLSGLASGDKPTSVLEQLSTLQSLVQRRETEKLAEALEELRDTPALSEGESAAVGALLQYWVTDILPAHGGEEAELPQVPPGGRQSR